MIINGVVINDSFMFETIKSIAEESGISDIKVIAETYQELKDKTKEGKSWNCKMIDEILAEKIRSQNGNIN